MAEKSGSCSAALQWVERLLEPSASEEMMVEALRSIPHKAQVFVPGHYKDVVEERRIDGLCGYPLCGRPLGPQPPQKYHISLAQKKVFDLTQRKKFCSVECYRASNYYASQLSSLPTAARDGKSVAISFLPPISSNTECLNAKSTTDVSSVSNTLAEHEPIKEVSPHDLTLQETTRKICALSVKGDSSSGHEYDESLLKKEIDAQEVPSTAEGRESVQSVDRPSLSSVGHLLHAMSSWCTPDTWQFVSQTRGKQERQRVSDVEEDNVRERTVTVGCLSYTGSGAVENSDILRGGLESVAEVGQERAQTRGEGRDDCGVVLPALHSSAHSQLQMTIFIQHLKRNLPRFAADLSLNVDETLPRLLPLVRTFRFSRYTVMFKPAEWRVILLVLLCIVAPDWEVDSGSLSGVIQQWLAGVEATRADLDLMLNIFTQNNA